MRGKSFIHIFLISSVLIVLLSTCTHQQTSAQSRRGGKVTIGLTGNIASLFPFNINEYFALDISQFLLNPSFTAVVDENHISPRVAGAWRIADDKQSITYFLNKNYHWSNGHPLRAADVSATFRFIKNFPELARSFPYLDTLIVKDSLTVQFHLTRPVRDLEGWTRIPILYLTKIPYTEQIDKFKKKFENSFVGCGPFILAQKTQQSLLLVRNPYFPDNKPYIDSLLFRFYPTTDALAAALAKQEVDIVPSLPLQMVKQLPISQNYHLDSRLESGFEFIAWNLSSPLVKSLYVRKALTYALDRQTLVDGLLGGYGFVHENPAPPDFWVYHQAPLIPYDPEKAEEVLAAQGWKKRESDGLLIQNNKPLQLRLLTNEENRLRQNLLNNISSYYKKIGAKVQTEILPWDTFIKRIHSGEFDGAIVGWGANPSSSLSELFHSSQIENGSNLMGYHNNLVDQLLTAAQTEPDSRKAKEACLKAQEQIVHDMPVTVLFTKKEIRLAKKRVHNINLHHKSIFTDAAEWYIE